MKFIPVQLLAIYNVLWALYDVTKGLVPTSLCLTTDVLKSRVEKV